ncbi:MAG: transcriptional regulator [Actinobacteria bacterium]|nr:MAG: transcriptional regulator [Actinomycetota bacterium]
MSHPASRVLAMLELLQTHPRLTGADLGHRLGVDERTIRRYAATLADLGIPVVATRGRYGGYRLGGGRRLPPLMLTDEEGLAVLVGLAAAAHLGLTPEVPGTPAAFDKLRRVLPEALAARFTALRERLGFAEPRREGDARPAGTTLRTLAAAVRSRRRVSLTYRSWRGSVTLRELDPYGVVFHAGRWHVVGYDHRRQEIRSFMVDRIRAVDVGEATFDVPDRFDPVRHVTRELAGGAYTWDVEVLLETDPDAARQRVPAALAEITETADGVLLRSRVRDLAEMARLLAGLGWPFTIVRPAELRAAVAAHAARLSELAIRGPAPVGGNG